MLSSYAISYMLLKWGASTSHKTLCDLLIPSVFQTQQQHLRHVYIAVPLLQIM